ncbi:alpha-amylase family glycosyl hydrolase [Bacillus sp. NEB1478]|nr:alpha-amylase family glycosyl hydrolase [Bacillus sp. NEB1478]WNB92369.1 alpha-amylase family glycosyl hydrolase [Bacillus sp. NEB1478]
MRKRKSFKSVSWLLLFTMILQTFASTILFHPAKTTAAERTVTLVGDLQSELGASGDWNPADTATKMERQANGKYKLKGTLPAGNYEYKIAINGSWDENYGVDGKAGGDNYKLTVDSDKEVTFVYDDTTHKVSILEPLPQEQTPRIVGSIQPAIGAGGEWSPGESTAFLKDEDTDNIYTYTTQVPKGKYEFKIVLGNSWDAPAYPGNNFALNVVKDATITFFYNHDTKEVYTDYDAGLPDGSVKGDKLFHDTWNEAYRAPFGAIKAGQDVTLRLQSKKGDLTGAKLYLRNYNSGSTTVKEMENAGWTTINGEEVELWEATVTPDEKGVYGYKFEARDGDAIKEYGEDTQEGGKGAVSDTNAGLFQMTVYDPAYKTPDWMKESVVYQIFPDRFFNGNKKNDDDKTTARGTEPIEHRDWSKLPDNPRLAENEGYDGDLIWSNDFFGGDIAGIQKKLDYIQSLGVNTLYLNPIANASSNHKYDATDYKAIDPMFGTPAEFKAFTIELKKRGMHLILDGVFNHVGDDSIYFDRYSKYETVGAYEYWSSVYDLMNSQGLTEAQAKKKTEDTFIKEGQKFSPYGFENWFNIENKKVDGVYKYQAWWGFDSLPEIKSIPGEAVDYDSELNNKSFADYIMYKKDSVAKSWLDRGASGWRLDVANEVDTEFWREFRNELKTGKKEEPLILGEIWDDASEYFLGDLYDSVMNYRFRGAMIDYLKNGNAKGAENQLNAVFEDYPQEAFYALMNLMGSHDTPRAAFVLGNGTDSYERAELDPNYDSELGKKRLKLASILQMGYAGAPTVYYGDEAGVTGSKDPDDRRTYPWGHEDQDLVKHYQAIGKVRTDYHDLFSYGELNHLYAENDVLAYSRTDKKNAAIVVTNRGNEEKTVELDVKKLIVNNVKLTDQLNEKYNATVKNSKLTITVPAMSGRMLVTDKGQNLKQPKAVKHVKVTEGSHSVSLSWKGNSKHYAVYQTTVSGAFYEKVTDTRMNSVKIDGLDNGRKYYFAVVAVDKDNNESVKTEIKTAAIPHVELKTGNYEITNVTKLENGVIDLSKTQNVSADLFIKGETEKDQAEGLTAELQVKEPGKTSWTSHPANYTAQNGQSNQFSSSFLPFKEGTYEYRFAFTTDLGRTWVTSESNSVTFTKGSDTTAPANAVSLEQPAQESGQVNLKWTVDGANEPYLFTIFRDGEVIDQLLDTNAINYKDRNVTNGKTYAYEVHIYDKAGNSVKSNAVSVTPDLVMVKVTMKVNAPAYTPQGVDVTMPGSKNGWNTGAWKMTRGGAVTNDYEYTFEAQEGEVITYKYAKNSSWDQEGLADHTPGNSNDDDISLYGYGAPGTDMNFVVTNQGGNEMTVQDKILRWIDMPVVVTSHTDGQTVTSDTITLKGNAIKEGVMTINGQPVTINDDMTFSATVNLTNGENKLNIHIEPSEENKTTIFKNDGGAIGKNTKDIVMTIIKN